MFSKDNNRFKVNIKAQKETNVIDFTAASQRRAARDTRHSRLRRKDERSLASRIAAIDLRTPWVIRLIAVLSILILSMLIL